MAPPALRRGGALSRPRRDGGRVVGVNTRETARGRAPGRERSVTEVTVLPLHFAAKRADTSLMTHALHILLAADCLAEVLEFVAATLEVHHILHPHRHAGLKAHQLVLVPVTK